MNNSKLYLSYNHAQRADAQSILSEFSHFLRWNRDGSDSLLDVGCGPGDVLFDFIVPIMPENFHKVVGVDLSFKMIEFARSFKCQPEKITFQQMDISDEFEKCKKNIVDEPTLFNNVTSFCCLHWIQNQRQALSNIYNLLQPNGTAIMSFLVSSPSYDIYETLSEMPEYKDYTRNINSFVSPYHHDENPLQTFQNHLNSIGFVEAKHVEIRERSFVYQPEQLRNAVKAVNPFTDAMPECLREQFLDDYVKIAEQFADNAIMRDNSTIVSRYQLMVAVLTKQSRI